MEAPKLIHKMVCIRNSISNEVSANYLLPHPKAPLRLRSLVLFFFSFFFIDIEAAIHQRVRGSISRAKNARFGLLRACLYNTRTHVLLALMFLTCSAHDECMHA